MLKHDLTILGVVVLLFGCGDDGAAGEGSQDGGAGDGTAMTSTGTVTDTDATSPRGTSSDGTSDASDGSDSDDGETDDPFSLHTCSFTPDCGASFPGDCEGYPETCEAYDAATICALEALRDGTAFRIEEECCGLGPLGLTHVIADGRKGVLSQFRSEGDTTPGVHFEAVQRCTPKGQTYFETCLAAFDTSCRRTYDWWVACETVENSVCPG